MTEPVRDRDVRVGIDVGGTFTHAVAFDLTRHEVLTTVRVPTTHAAVEGVAAGIREALQLLLRRSGIVPREIRLIAHSTTQATNALLEGDTAVVGILGMGAGLAASRARTLTALPPVLLGAGRPLATVHGFLDLARPLTPERVDRALDELQAHGARVLVASQAFGVDDDGAERTVEERREARGMPGTTAAALSGLYGLRQRTRTAVINASILPRMLSTADETERSVRREGVESPLMIMRSDGGVMDIGEMRRRPIQTILSGPAAGVAAALRFSRVSDGIFVEVGGTSTDISVIKDGGACHRGARVGGHALHLRTLDVRTVGVAGGSIPRVRGGRLDMVGPRSAHIAGARYACFAGPGTADEFHVDKLFEGSAGGGSYLLAVRSDSGEVLAFTPTCAANLLGWIPDGDDAHAPGGGAAPAVAEALGRFLGGMDPTDLARRVMELGADPLEATIRGLVGEYRLDPGLFTLVGGGGGAAIWVPWLGRRLGMRTVVVDHAPVISAIGVACSMARETLERSVVDPTDSDLLALRQAVVERLVLGGCDPATIQVEMEVDPRRNLLRASGSGAVAMEERRHDGHLSTPELARTVCPEGDHEVALRGETDWFAIFEVSRERRGLFGRSRQESTLRVVDRSGVVRLQKRRGRVARTGLDGLTGALAALLDETASYGDSGRELPELFLVHGVQISDLSGLTTTDQMLALARAEVQGSPGSREVYLVAAPRG